jgi:Short-chain dehydrogenases of various substrate specificities
MKIMKYKNFIITGAASGLGKSLAQKLLADGKNVIGIDQDKIEINADNLSGNLKTIVFDLKDYEKVNQLFDINEIQEIDCLINCAGYETAGFVDDLPLKEITRNFNVNTMAPIALTKFLLPIFKKK